MQKTLNDLLISFDSVLSHSELLTMFDNFYFQIFVVFVRVEKVKNNGALLKAIFKIYGSLCPLLYVTYYNI